MAEKIGIGLMSGTSGDGVDSALVRFWGKAKVEILFTGFLPFPKRVREDIADASSSDGSAELICRLNVTLGKLFARAALELSGKSGVSLSEVDFIGSHGQTIRHQPSSRRGGVSSTLQLGEAAEIAEITGCTVVSDFRPFDIAAGGSGAPLAPIAHFDLFVSKKETRIVHNLGGISNVTFLPKRVSLSDVRGFDTGPGNSLLDLASGAFSKRRMNYDRDGKTALKGRVDNGMYEYCMSHPYFRKRPPKSTGREVFGDDYFGGLYRKFKKIGRCDFLRTLSAVTAHSSVMQALRFFDVRERVRWIVCGGGAYNGAVILELKNALGDKGSVSPSSELGVGEKSVEAVLMAILAHRTLKGEPGNLPRVTGAKKPVVLGKISNSSPRKRSI